MIPSHLTLARLSARQWVERYHSPFNLDQGLGEDFVAMALTGHMPGELDDLSIHGFASDRLAQQLKEPHEYSLKGGYDTLIQALALRRQTSHEITPGILV